jgi:hypothetical protein
VTKARSSKKNSAGSPFARRDLTRSRMLLKGDEGGCKIRRGGGRKWRFSPGGSLPLDDLSVTSNRDSSLATQRSSTTPLGKRLPRGAPPPTKSVIYAALGLPPGGTPSISLIPPKALVVVDSRQSGPPSHRHPGRWDSVPEIAPVNPALAAMANALRVHIAPGLPVLSRR